MSWQRVRNVLQRTLFFPARANRDLDDEIRFHLAEEARLQSERGLSAEDAAVAARRLFGNVAVAKEETRAVWLVRSCHGNRCAAVHLQPVASLSRERNPEIGELRDSGRTAPRCRKRRPNSRSSGRSCSRPDRI